MSKEVIDLVAALFDARGDSLYGGEGVTQGEHALQAALLAEQSGAPPAQIVAALLHDVGHLLHDLPDDAPDQGLDDVHEELGYEWLRCHFVPAVSEPVRLHVAAKRYLCAVDPAYLQLLSPPSLQSLELQGGPFTPREIKEFESRPFFRESVELRRWDDQAKVSGMSTPSTAYFLSFVADLVRETQPSRAMQ